MTKKESLLLQGILLLGAFAVAVVIFVLVGCSSSSNETDGSVSDGAYFVTSDRGSITEQEVFDDIMASGGDLFVLLDLVDDIVLRANFEIDVDEVDEIMDTMKNESEDFDAWMAEQGFLEEDEVIVAIERHILRDTAVRSLVVVTDEELEAVFDAMFGDDEEADFDELRDILYDYIVEEHMNEAQAMLPTFLAEWRHEAGFVIYDERLVEAYEQFLSVVTFGALDMNEAEEQDETDVIARIGDEEITEDQLFEASIDELGLQTAINLMFAAEFAPTEARLKELHAEAGRGRVSGSHILIGNPETDDAETMAENQALANDLIEQLKEADDFSEMFAELAAEHSRCGSSESGGDLGSWEYGTMVPEFDDVIFALEVGAFTSEPVETVFGFHIIYKTGFEGGATFDEMRDELEAAELARLRQTDAMTTFLVEIYEEADVTFANPVLQAQFETIMSRFEQSTP